MTIVREIQSQKWSQKSLNLSENRRELKTILGQYGSYIHENSFVQKCSRYLCMNKKRPTTIMHFHPFSSSHLLQLDCLNGKLLSLREKKKTKPFSPIISSFLVFWNPTHFFYGHKGSQIASLVVFQLRAQF